MSKMGNKLKALVAGIVYGAFSGMPVMADDTEIYVGSNLGVNDVAPNILFILDTSGSMDSTVVVRDPYDPSYDYSQNAGACFSNSRLYTSTSTWCSTSSYFDASAFKCNAAVAPLATTGFYQDNMGQWRSRRGTYRWRSIDNASDLVECQSDNGVHGNGGAATYAADNNGPWSTNSSDQVNLNDNTTVYSGNYKNYLVTTPITSSSTRIQTMKDVLTNVVGSVNNVNIGLMRFSQNAEGGMVITPMNKIENNRTQFISDMNAMTANGYTPLAETMIEAAKYYQGKAVDYGASSTPVLSHADSRTPSGGSIYKTPIEFQCQKNFAVLLTDGEPTQDSPSSARLTAIGVTSGCGTDGSCLDEIAGAIAAQDQSTAFIEKQVVSTYTIGLALDHPLLKATAKASKDASGSGAYYTADNAEQLTNVFTNILTDILSVSSTFSSPAVSVNAFNRTSHRSDLYFTLFKPQNGPHWDGNFKRYRLAFLSDGTPEIRDANDELAVSDTTGYFVDSSQSFWTDVTDAPDGKEAGAGGAASKLTNTRKVYTISGSNYDLTAAENLLHESNSALDLNVLGITDKDAAYRDLMLKWARGIDTYDDDGDGSTTDARRIMGDPLHGQPALVQYNGPDSDPYLVSYVVTNDGYLHAFDTRLAAGTEIFSFVPKELLDRLRVFYDEDVNVVKPYGIDGTVVPWVEDTNLNGIIDGSDHVYIYFGMRRGGNNYYAMDVTNPSAPKVKWVIKGGSGAFAELGQTWSKPTLRKVSINGQSKHVLIFAGGYDDAQDGKSLRSDDSVGRAIYIVDADNGALLWSAGIQATADMTLPDMKYSIPSDVAAVDSTGDGYVNMLFVGDMGGQVWRFDIARDDGASSLSNRITGGRIADLAGGGPADNRRFYYQPDAAILKHASDGPYISLIMSTGNRSHPLSTTVQDRIYMIRQRPVNGAPLSYDLIKESDLFDTTSNIIGEGTAVEQQTAQQDLDGKQGWYIDLELTGEKGLAKPLIFAGFAFVTSYVPTDNSSGISCAPREGKGRLFIINLADGTPVYNFDKTVDSEENLTKDDRVKDLNKAGIPADPILIKTNDPNQKNMANCVGTECFEVEGTNTHETLYWYEQ